MVDHEGPLGLLASRRAPLSLRAGGCCDAKLANACAHTRGPNGDVGFCWERVENQNHTLVANVSLPTGSWANVTFPIDVIANNISDKKKE